MLGDILRKLREDKEKSQKEVAEVMGVSASTIGMYEQNRRKPDSDMLKAFSDYFGVSVDYLLGRSNIRTTQPTEKEKTMSKEVETIAAHLDDKELTPHKVKMIKRYIDDLFDEEF